jgi:FtsP/CotA-like multicopper oxidase with cupredoxin domain
MTTNTDPKGLFTRRQMLQEVLVGGTLLAGCTGNQEQSELGPQQDGNETVDPRLQLEDVTLSSAFVIELVDPNSGDQLTTVHWHGEYSHWHFAPLEIPFETARTVEVVFNDRDLTKVPLGPSETYQVAVKRTPETPTDLFEIRIDGSLVDIRGNSRDEGGLVFQLENDGEGVWTSPVLPVEVG